MFVEKWGEEEAEIAEYDEELSKEKEVNTFTGTKKDDIDNTASKVRAITFFIL